MWVYHDGWQWWMLFGGLGTLLFWGVLIWFIVFAVRAVFGGERYPRHVNGVAVEDAEAIARRRFAAGEISEEEFHRIVETLRH